MLGYLEKSNLAKLSDEGLRGARRPAAGRVGLVVVEVTRYTAAAQLSEQVIRKLKAADLADPAVLFRGQRQPSGWRRSGPLRHAADTGHVEAYLAQFGHFVESADPIHPTLHESPETPHPIPRGRPPD